MKLETFFEHFDLLAEAPNGVQKLRELILDLAVRGKLVTQDANDEPAVVLLERIKKEKERLVKEKRIKKSSLLSPIKLEEQPCILPKSWLWQKIGNLCFVTKLAGFEYTKYFALSERGEVPVIRAQNVKMNKIDQTNLRYIDFNISNILERSALTKPAILMTFIGAGIGDVAIFDFQERWHLAPNVAKLEPFNYYCENLDIKYILTFLMSTIGRDEIFKSRKSTAQPSLSMDTIRDINIAIPPLAEQKRIVTKVDELMKLCDELEARQKKKRETRILINNAALNKLLTADTPETFTKNWQCISDNFDILYSAPENIGKLRQAILQLAVMGKLVPQDANDEPAAVLLERIKKEKERLIKEGKVKKEKSLPAIKDDEIQFTSPKGWSWERFGQIADIVSGVTKGRILTNRKTAFYPYLRVANVQTGFLKLEVIKEIEIPIEELEKYRLQVGDILLTEGGDWDKLGRSAIWNGVIDNCIHQNHIFRARPLHTNLTSQWVVLYTNSPIGRHYFESASKKTTNLASINMTQLRHCPFPIPPFEEQKRIVAKVDKLMKLCDELETKLIQTQTESEKIINAAVKQLLTV